MISVCIATYNGARYIREQLESILSQLGEDDEVIVSDDASTDDTVAIIESFRDKRVRILHHTPYAQSRFPLDKSTHNFENALREAKGDYIFLSDQDDVWLPNKVSSMLEALQTADLAVHDCQVVDSNLQLIRPSYFDYIHVHKDVLYNIWRSSCPGCCMAFRRSVGQIALPFPPSFVAHDQWLVIVANLRGKVTIVPQPLILYRKHSLSQTTSGSKSRYSLAFKLWYRIVVLCYTCLKYLKIY